MQPNLPQDIGTELEDIRRRLRALETSPSMQYTAQKGGTFWLISPTTGRSVQVFGQFNQGGSPFYGAATYDGDGKSMVMTRDDTGGLVKPDIPAGFRPTSGITITGATFASWLEWQGRGIYHDSLAIDLPTYTDATGAGEVKIVEGFTSTSTDTLVVPANGGFKTARFLWKHGLTVGDDGPLFGPYIFQIQVRLTSGGGQFAIYGPRMASMCSSVLLVGAAANGNPQLL